MKINYNYYSGKDLYSDGEIENEIIQYEKEYENIEDVFTKDIRWPVFYHLTPIRKNILNWYPFQENSEVLEIGAGMGAITEVLCEKCKSVVAVELSKNRATSIATRNQEKENLEIIVGNLNDIDFKDRKFDYITLIGVFEYAALYTNTENPYIDFLNHIKKLLKPNGKILIAIENKFGMKYWLGAPEDHTNIKYDGITGYENKDFVQTFGKEEIEQILKTCGLSFMKFYYPLPDYKLPNVLFSDEYLPNSQTIENYTPYYYEGTQIEFNEKKAYKEIIKNKMFPFFANSFFIECSQSEITTQVNLETIELIPISKNAEKFYEKDYTKKENKVQIEEMKREIESLKNKIKQMEHSKSWNITKPLRMIGENFKNKKHK